MANRIVGNVYIVDSSTGNVAMSWPSKAKIGSVAFWSTNTTGEVIFTGADTTNVVIRLANPNNAATTVGLYLGGVNYTEMKVPTLTAGTAWFYLV
jgi:hypothetical protein